MATKQEVDDLKKFGDHVDLLHPSKYLKACDLKGKDVTVTIERLNPRDELKMRTGKTEKKPTIKFRGTEKLLCLNKTNAQAIAKIHGTELTGWLDKKITLYPTRVMFGRDEVDAVRVRATKAETKQEQPHDPVTGEVTETTTEKEPGSEG